MWGKKVSRDPVRFGVYELGNWICDLIGDGMGGTVGSNFSQLFLGVACIKRKFWGEHGCLGNYLAKKRRMVMGIGKICCLFDYGNVSSGVGIP